MDEQMTIDALSRIFQPGDVFEIRVLDAERPGYRRPHVESGYFDYEHIGVVPEVLAELSTYGGVYYTPNPVDPALLARACNRIRPVRGEPTTSDGDVVELRWLLLDFDPKRPAGIASTDAEHALALNKAIHVTDGLTTIDWPKPLVVDSGNGFQAMYRVQLARDERELVHRCLQALAVVSDAEVEIDQSVHNPARIWRLPGTMNRKGDDMADRPHRMAEVVEWPDETDSVTREQLDSLAGHAPSDPRPAHTTRSVPTGDRPGDAFNAGGDLGAVLVSHGWQLMGEHDGNQHWRRPGKTKGRLSATFDGSTFYVFSSSAPPFTGNTGYSKFQVYTMLDHAGDHTAAARALIADGFGESRPLAGSDVDLTGIMNTITGTGSGTTDSTADPLAPAIDRFQPKTLAQRQAEDGCELNPPVIHGLLRVAETMNIIASPKMGKSWLSASLAISIAAGLDWMGMEVEQGMVLHIDNELHANTSTYRYGVVAEAMGVPLAVFSENIVTVSLRGRLADLQQLAELFEAYPPETFKMVIIDAFYRALPVGTDENDNGAIAGLYNVIDRHAARMDCAFVLIHHSSKGNQAFKTVTDVGAGAGSQSRAVDTHLVLRPHQEQDITIMDAAIRSWPPMEPVALHWEWPLFTVTQEVDVSALMGVETPSSKKTAVSLDDFVETCVALHEPCSERGVVYEAQRVLDMSERQAKDNLALALERGLVARIKGKGARMVYVLARPGLSGDGALWVAALIAQDDDMSTADIAEQTGQSRQYVNQIRRHLATANDGNSVETGNGNSEISFHSVSVESES